MNTDYHMVTTELSSFSKRGTCRLSVRLLLACLMCTMASVVWMQAMNYHKYVFVPTPVRSEVPASVSHNEDLTTSCSSGAGGGVQTVPREALSEATVNGIKTEPNAPSAAAADNRGSACTQESKTDKV